MTHEELTQNIDKFHSYLEANGVRVIGNSLHFEMNGHVHCFIKGNKEVLEEMAIAVLADIAGFKLEMKS